MDFDLGLYMVTDSGLARGRRLLDIVDKAVAGGVTLIQLREKECPTRAFVALGRALKKHLTGKQVPLIINDRLDVALACEADGIHLGQQDMPYAIARHILGPQKIIGLSVENQDDVDRSNQLDVDYIGVSPVFDTPTKTDTGQSFGLDGLTLAVKRSVHRSVAIGGIHLSNIAQVMRSGTEGVAVVSAIMSASDPALAARELKAMVNRSRKNRAFS